MRDSSGDGLISDKMTNICLFICFTSTKQMQLFVWILGDNLPSLGNLVVPLAAIVQVFQQIHHAMEREPKKQWVKMGKKEENL